MRFCLVDKVLEQDETHAVTLKVVSMAEEYLQDHFATFPALPGVFMLEAMVQAARLVADAKDPNTRWVLGEVKALKYGTFVRPGDTLRVRVDLGKPNAEGELDFKGEAEVLRPGTDGLPQPAAKAASGRLRLRPLRPFAVGPATAVGGS